MRGRSQLIGLLLGLAASPLATAQTAATDTAATDTIPANSVGASTRAPAPAAPEKSTSALPEIIVTAQRRDEKLQDVPISITVFDQDQLSNANVTDASALANYTPSLTANTRFGSDNSTFAIRGFTQDLRTTASVGVYFAEVISPRGQNIQASGDGAGPGDFFDLQNVQVLKGPQGTLFGRNSTGGAVLLSPRKPSDHFEGHIEASAGDYGAFVAEGVVNVPVTEWLKVRLGVSHNQRDGFLNNVSGIGPDDLADIGFTAVRLSVVVDLAENVENYTILAGVNSENHGFTGGLFACNPSPLPTENTFYAFVGVQCQAQMADQAASGHDGYYDMMSTIATPISRFRQRRVINTTTWRPSEDLSVKNILAYGHLETVNGQDIFGTRFHALYDLNPNREFKLGISVKSPDVPVTNQTTWVEEVQVQGTSFESDLQWQAGAYFERSLPDGYSGNNAAGFISCDVSTIEGDPSGFDCFDPTAGLLGGALQARLKTRYDNKAIYSQATWRLSEAFSVTGGVRYTWDETEGRSDTLRYTFTGSLRQPPTLLAANPKAKSDAPTGLAILEYRPATDVMTYAKYARGYRQGSVNVAANPGLDSWKPEVVDAYEIGAKTSFEGTIPVRFNAAIFYNDFTRQQLQAGYISPTYGPTTAIFNAGKSRIEGVEAEAYLQLLRGLNLTLSYSHLRTKLISQADHQADVQAIAGPIAGATYTPIANVGETLPYAPKDSYVASLGYRLPIPDDIGGILVGATYAYIGKQRAAASDSSPFAVLDSRSLLDLNASWLGILGLPLDLSIFATNVLDEHYITFLGGTYNTLGFESRNVGLPRMVGARLKYHFGE